MQRIDPSVPTDGLPIAFLGEAGGDTESLLNKVFVGPSGGLLWHMTKSAGIDLNQAWLGNVFLHQLPNNEVQSWCHNAAEAKKARPPPELKHLRPWLTIAVAPAAYLKPEYLWHLEELRQSLLAYKPNLVLALGNTAAWALLGLTGIRKMRGTVCESTLIPGLKVIPTFHPAAVLRMYDQMPVVVTDFIKARAQMDTPEFNPPAREIWLNPTVSDLGEWAGKYVHPRDILSFDIETGHGFITCIGFSTDAGNGLVIPFIDKAKPGYAYWKTLEDELFAMKFIYSLLAGPFPKKSFEKLAQNGLYDCQWIWRKWKMPVYGFCHDTMLLHHALQPELPKGLDFLGSIYTNERAWKTWRPRGQEVRKRDE